jgi:uncharacterized membrane protein (DUF2068 family)
MEPKQGLTAVRAVAVFEACKGTLVLLTATAAFHWIHHGAQHLADEIERHFVLNPASRYPRVIFEALSHPNNFDLVLLSLGAVLYASIRFAEAYGLWHGKTWAWVFGVVSAAIYIPFEVFDLIRHVTPIGIGILTVNILIVLALWRGRAIPERS